MAHVVARLVPQISCSVNVKVSTLKSTSDVPDQAAIVRQYMRYTAQLQSGRNIGKMVLRALQM